MAQDIKVRNIQIGGEIQPTAPQPVSGDVYIPVGAKLRYTEGFVLDDDYDLVYKSYLESLAVLFYYLDESSAYYSPSSGGSITIPDFDTDYPTLSANGIVRMQGYITVDGIASGGTIAEVEVDIIPVVTRIGGNITAATFNLGVFSPDVITTFKLRIY